MRKKNNQFTALIILIISVTFSLKAEEKPYQLNNSMEPSFKKLRKERPSYIAIGAGLNISKFRDFATSPLVYSGKPLQFSFSKIKSDHLRESEIGLSYGAGKYKSTFNESTAISKLKRVELYYSKLYYIKKLSNSDYNTKLGYSFNNTGNIRMNESLQNNATGIEYFGNLMGVIKITKDISRSKLKEKNFLFLKYKLKEKKRDLSIRLDLGIVNSTYRNGFIYSGQSQVLNNPKLFDGYTYKIFSGYRISSRVDYTKYLKNKNGIRLSYIWDAYSTGGNLDKFEMANHTLRFTFLFNTNNK